MAGAVQTTSHGHGSVYYNPARLAFDTSPSFSIGYSSGEFALTIDRQDIEVRSAPALTLGLSLPLPFLGWLEEFGVQLGTAKDAQFRSALGYLFVEGEHDETVIKYFFGI